MSEIKGNNLIFKAIFLVALFLGSCIITESSFAQNAKSADLINHAKQNDGLRVIYKGEVVGDVMKRGDFAWVNLNDGVNAIGIWVKKDLTKDIAYTGSYKFYGDVLEVEGIFHQSCREHGGDLDIHADVLRKIVNGSAIVDTLDTGKRNFVFTLLGVLCLVLILNQLKVK